MTKRIILALMTGLLLLLPATAHDFYVGGIYYNKNGNEATVTFRGNSYNEYANEYNGSITIPETVTYNGTTYSVTAISYSAFSSCSGLKSVSIPNSVISIDSYAFKECSGLTSILVENGNTVYDSRDNCNAIIETACNELIAGCKATSIPNSVTYIGSSAFEGCSGLTSITIPNSVTAIGSRAFHNCSGLTSVNIPNSVTVIGYNAFYGCSSLTSINIPNSVISIDSYAFKECSGLTSIEIPNSVIEIGHNALDGTSWFNNQPDGMIYAGLVAYKYKGTMPANTHITLREGTLGIAGGAFTGCSNLTSIDIPNSVISIGLEAFDGTRWYNSQPSGMVYAGLVAYKYKGTIPANTHITLREGTLAISSNAFFRCSGLTSITIPNSVTTINTDAFWSCSSLTSVNIPNSVTYIGNTAFQSCSNLTSVNIPNSVTHIGNYAFALGSGPNEVYSYIQDPSMIIMGCGVFGSPEYAFSRTLYVPIGSGIAYLADTRWIQYFGSIVEMEPVFVPATSIGINQTAVKATVGDTLQLIATVLPEDATDKTVAWTTSNSSVATVDSIGLVTAVAPGTVTITATTTDGTDLSASCTVAVKENLSNYDNYLSINDVEAYCYDTMVIPVKMTNQASIISFQTDIFLPEGLELQQQDGEYLIDPSSRMANSHSIMSNDVSNGAIRVICYSSNYKPFTGNSGDDLFYFTVKVTSEAEDGCAIALRNTLLTTSDFEEIDAPNSTAFVNVKASIIGDANGSHTVTMADLVATLQYILELNPQPFIFETADVNNDGCITVTDMSRIVWMVLNPSENAPLRAPALWNNGDRMTADGITLAAGETRTVGIRLDNGTDYCGFQIDLNLPQGLTASNFRVTDRAGNHAVDVNALRNGNIRALCYSPALNAIHGHEGDLLTFDVTAAGDMNGDITVDGIELVTTECQSVKLDAFTIGVNKASSINESITGKAIAKVEYFNLAGQKVEQPSAGLTLVVTTYTDGSRTTAKVIN